jgi:hypothetical protein
MSSSFRFYCCSSGLDIFIKYGYYDIRAEAVQISIFSLRGVALCEGDLELEVGPYFAIYFFPLHFFL